MSQHPLTYAPAGTVARPRRSGDAGLARGLAAILSGFGLFIVLLTFQPFSAAYPSPEAATDGGNVVNQIGYFSLGILYLFALLTLADRAILPRLVQPGWLVFAVALLSLSQAGDPGAAFRGILLTAIVLIVVMGILVLPRSEKNFVDAGAAAMLALLAINYLAVLLAPGLAIHSADSWESWHAGFWRGHLAHKNFAAPVFSIIAMFGIYCLRSGATLRGLLITALAVNFVLHTGSKTTLGFLPLALLVVLAGRLTGRPGLAVLLHLAITVAVALLTIGTIWSPSLEEITARLIDDTTFTGRNAIWEFGVAHLSDRPWLGFGYYSFWTTPAVTGLERDFEAAWDVRGIISGHNTYLDLMITFGIPGGLLVAAMLFVKPLVDYVRGSRRPENRRLADFFLMVVAFMTYTGMLESFALNRADPMWLALALAVSGLALLAGADVRRAGAPSSARPQPDAAASPAIPRGTAARHSGR